MLQFNSPLLSDLTLELKSVTDPSVIKVVKVHKFVLITQSPYFATLISTNFKENELMSQQKAIILTVVDVELAIKLLKWLYQNPINLYGSINYNWTTFPLECHLEADMWLLRHDQNFTEPVNSQDYYFIVKNLHHLLILLANQDNFVATMKHYNTEGYPDDENIEPFPVKLDRSFSVKDLPVKLTQLVTSFTEKLCWNPIIFVNKHFNVENKELVNKGYFHQHWSFADADFYFIRMYDNMCTNYCLTENNYHSDYYVTTINDFFSKYFLLGFTAGTTVDCGLILDNYDNFWSQMHSNIAEEYRLKCEQLNAEYSKINKPPTHAVAAAVCVSALAASTLPLNPVRFSRR